MEKRVHCKRKAISTPFLLPHNVLTPNYSTIGTHCPFGLKHPHRRVAAHSALTCPCSGEAQQCSGMKQHFLQH